MNLNSVVEFREGEIDGKRFLIYNLLSQRDTLSSSSSSGEVAIDSGGEDLPTQPLFSCPFMRFNRRNSEEYIFVPMVVPPQFPSIEGHHQEPEYMCRSECRKLPLLPLFWCNNKNPDRSDFSCYACSKEELGTSYYFCVTCGRQFHKECVGSPIKFKHPSYPSLSLQLYSPPSLKHGRVKCSCCNDRIYGISYYCPSKKFHLDLLCAFKPIPIVIDNPKRHPHPLTFFPKQAFLPCHVCGLIIEHIPTYVCLRCVFVVHQKCIYFPYAIRISRHHHRISYTSSLPSGELSCGVCRKKIDNDYGAYSCNKCDGYFVHSRCALRRDLWDGEELEGIPEEPEIIVEPFKKIADGIILHFSHDHHLKLQISKVYDQHRLCQTCVLPIYEGKYYSCIDECDFIFHESCANAPCKIYHPLHSSPLTLVVVNKGYGLAEKTGFFTCDACQRRSCGFVYENVNFRRVGRIFKLCLRCASVSEPFEYQGHKHPLYLSFNPEEEKAAVCRICQDVPDESYPCRILNCIECGFVICFMCATLPYKAMYQHDTHFLTFYEAKEAKGHSEWCDVCERKIGDSIKKDFTSRKKGFYSCDDCCTTLHIDCLLGEDMYMKPGQTIRRGEKFQILHNNTLSRPVCNRCSQHCPQKVVFKHNKYAYCAIDCLFRWTPHEEEEE